MNTAPIPPGHVAGELLVRAGPGKGVCHPLAAPVTLVGRGPECDLRVGDLTVRPAHCVLAHASDGVHLRSLGGPTIVNGLPTLARTLVEGDVIALGPVEVQVRFTPRLPSDPPPADRKTAPWRRYLARGRARLLNERAALRADFAKHLQALAVGRAEADDARAAAAAERERLRDLRRRFVRRWRAHWADERARVTAERTFLAAEIDRLTGERDEARRDRAISTEHFDRREAELARREAEQDVRRADLEQELAGLEARIAHARAAVPPGPVTAVATPDVPDVPGLAARRAAVERAAEEIDDQRRAIVEHLTDLAVVRAGEQEAADLLTDLVADIGRLEAAVVADRATLDAWHARLVVREGQVEQREIDVTAREQQAARDEESLNQLAARWASLRRAEESRVKADLDLATLLRERVSASAVPAEAEALADLFRATAERVALLVYREQELADREVDAARREIDAHAAADARQVEAFRRQAAIARAEREVVALRDEVRRLAGYADRVAGPTLRIA